MTYYIYKDEIWSTTNPKSVPAGAIVLTPLQYELATLLRRNSPDTLCAEIDKVHKILKGQE